MFRPNCQTRTFSGAVATTWGTVIAIRAGLTVQRAASGVIANHGTPLASLPIGDVISLSPIDLCGKHASRAEVCRGAQPISMHAGTMPPAFMKDA
jgi:hypothetical protein